MVNSKIQLQIVILYHNIFLRYFFGSKDCEKKNSVPAMPEDAEQLGYKEVCNGDEYAEESRINNTWSIENCPSKLKIDKKLILVNLIYAKTLGPCLQNGPCPQYAQCIDESDDMGPKYRCECQMGLFMEGGQVNLFCFYFFSNFHKILMIFNSV